MLRRPGSSRIGWPSSPAIIFRWELRFGEALIASAMREGEFFFSASFTGIPDSDEDRVGEQGRRGDEDGASPDSAASAGARPDRGGLVREGAEGIAEHAGVEPGPFERHPPPPGG